MTLAEGTLKKVALWLAALVALAYASSIHGSFHFDDSHSVETNVAIRSMANIPQFWTDPSTSSFIAENRVYRPLVYTFYSVCWWIGGGETWPFHLMKMTMHWLATLALFLIWVRLWSVPGWFPVRDLKIRLPFSPRELDVTPGLAAVVLASIFAVHPANSEVVNYISSTTSLQASLFAAWGYYFYLRHRDAGADARWSKWLGGSLLFYFLAVASKEIGITLVALVGLTELFLTEGDARTRLRVAVRRAAPFIALGIVLAIWLFAMMPASGAESRGPVSPHHYFYTQWRAWLWYMRLWFWPFDLNADDAAMTFSLSPFEAKALQALIGNLLILAFAWARRKTLPALLFGVLWFYIAVSPDSSFVPLAEAVNERRFYLAYVAFTGGVFTFVLWLLERGFAPEGRSARMGWALGLIMIGLFIGTQERNRVWRNGENLWLDTVEKNPTSGRALNNLALVYMARGEHAKAIDYFEKCEFYWSSYAYCPLNKGISLRALGRHDEAERSLLKAHSLNPSNTHVNFHIAAFYEEVRKDLAKALPYYEKADEVTGSRYPAAKLRQASILQNQGKLDAARERILEAARVDPNDAGVWFNLGNLELNARRLGEAADAYRRLLEIDSGHLGGWYNYGVTLLQAGQWAEARKAFESTVRIDPKSQQGWYNLAYVSEKLQDGGRALTAARELTRIAPDNASFQSRLGELERKFGKEPR